MSKVIGTISSFCRQYIVIWNIKKDLRYNGRGTILVLVLAGGAEYKSSKLKGGDLGMKQRNFGSLDGNSKHRGISVLSKVLLITLIAGLCTACMTKEVAKNTASDEPDPIAGFAWEAINRDIANYESNPEIKITDKKITRLELLESFDALADYPIHVYALEYRLKPEDLSKVVLAGGMDVDEDGWLKETCSMGSPLLVVSDKDGKIELIGTLWTGGVAEEGGMEASIKVLLERN